MTITHKIEFTNDYLFHIIIYVDGKQIGVVKLDMPKKGKIGIPQLFVLQVDPEYRRQGHGTRLIRLCQTLTDSIELCCYDRTELIEMYRKCGFKIIGACRTIKHNSGKLEKQVKMYWKKV